MISSLKKLANTLQNDYVSKGLYRNLLFEIFRSISEESQKRNHSIIGNTIVFLKNQNFISTHKLKKSYTTLLFS